jgi:hypothetical protein
MRNSRSASVALMLVLSLVFSSQTFAANEVAPKDETPWYYPSRILRDAFWGGLVGGVLGVITCSEKRAAAIKGLRKLIGQAPLGITHQGGGPAHDDHGGGDGGFKGTVAIMPRGQGQELVLARTVVVDAAQLNSQRQMAVLREIRTLSQSLTSPNNAQNLANERRLHDLAMTATRMGFAGFLSLDDPYLTLRDLGALMHNVDQDGERARVFAMETLADAVFRGSLGMSKLTRDKRMAMLRQLAKQGSAKAKQYLADLSARHRPPSHSNMNGQFLQQQDLLRRIYEGNGGLERMSGAKRFAMLKQLASMGMREATDYMVRATIDGELGQDEVPELERMAFLNAQFEAGNLVAAEHFATEIYSGRDLAEISTDDERFGMLEHLARAGVAAAQRLLARAIADGALGQRQIPLQQRMEILARMAWENNDEARGIMVDHFAKDGRNGDLVRFAYQVMNYSI